MTLLASPCRCRLIPVLSLLVSLALPAAALSAEGCPDRARTTEAAPLRLAADASAVTVAFVRADVFVELISCEPGWAEVDAGAGGRGWLDLSLLAAAGPEAPGLLATVAPGFGQAPPPAGARPGGVTPLAEEVASPGGVPGQQGSVQPRRPLLLRQEPSWSSPVAGRSPAGRPVQVLSASELGWSLVDAGLDRPAWVVTAALDAPPLLSVR